MFYRQLEEDQMVECHLCPHQCRIRPGRRGICGVRENQKGTLYTLVYGRTIAANIDPMEKKPLYHFLPGTQAFSIATVGCNFRCLFCQNADISQASKETGWGRGWEEMGRELAPEEIVALAQRYRCQSIAYTYTEPTIFFEYAYDTARLAQEKGIKNVFVTNGYITLEALEVLHPYLDAANVDLKSFRDEFYRRLCGAQLQPVLAAIRRMHELGIWVEVTTLVIPGENDSDEELEQIAQFVASVAVDLPWHVSRFIPHHRMLDVPITSTSALHRAAQIGKEAGLRHIYVGNIPGDELENTFCPSCGKVVIGRTGYRTRVYLKENQCPYCGYHLALVSE